MRYAIAAVVTLGLALITWTVDLPKALGVHPWWSQQVLTTGALIGLALGVAVNRAFKGRAIALLSLLVGTAMGFAMAKYGQTQFAASYAEDAFAGQLWYFGWHATCALGFATITAASLFRRPIPAQ